MATLAQLGITTQRQFLSDSAFSGALKKTTKLTLTLPKASPLKAEFIPEGLTKKLSKLFTTELQTGAPSFDTAIYITTDTPQATASFLESDDVRALVARLVANGPLSIVENTVTAVVPHHDHGEDDNVTQLVAAVLRHR